jgi:hypothetical protein
VISITFLKASRLFIYTSSLANRSADDPQALACDAYKLCFFDNLKRNELEVTRLVDNAGKNLLAQLTYVHPVCIPFTHTHIMQ